MKPRIKSTSKAITQSSRRCKRTLKTMAGLLIASALGVVAVFTQSSRFLSGSAAAQGEGISQGALRQIEALIEEKESRTPSQMKIDSQLLYSLKQKRGERMAPGVESLAMGVREAADGSVLLDIQARVTPEVLGAIRKAGGEVVYSYEQFGAIRARLPMGALEAIAGLDEIKFIGPAEEGMNNGAGVRRSVNGQGKAAAAPRPTRAERRERVREQLRQALPLIAKRTNPAVSPGLNAGGRKFVPAFTGAVNSQGDVAHRADQVRALGINGNGVRIGVLSDGVDSLAALQMAGELPAVTVVPGQAGSGTEGTAMLEIVNDLAPGAQLFFATALNGQANMAANILALAGGSNNCDIIIDDFTYFAEGVFQDDVIARAVNTVTAAEALYFSDAANGGNLNDGQSGVWEGDFVDGGTLALLPGGHVHDFGGGAISDPLTRIGGGGGSRFPVTLKWSDPLGGSNNDYDLFILNSTLTAVIAFSTNVQNGSQNPVEVINNNQPPNPPRFNVGDRLVIFRRNGAATRALHLDTNRGRLAIGTDGQTFGHNAAGSAFTVAAVNVATAGGGVFVGGATNPVETFTSDGPRRIFYDPAGNAITPGNILFGTNGGQVLQKPDLAAADGVSTATPGFLTFFGTSAAAPHAGAIAGLLLSFNNALTPAQIRTALTSTALDIEAAGVDRDSGAGIVMALQALGSVSSADLAVTKADSPDPVIAGTDLTYTINVSNNGSGPAVFARWQDALPDGTRLQSFSPAAGWSCATPPIGSGGSITCNKDTMADGESASFSIVVRVDPGVADGATLSNTATVSSTVADPNGANNSATATTSVIRRADLQVVSKVDSPDPVMTNSPLAYTITLRNNGPSVATGVTLSDPLPPGALFNNCSSTGGGVCGGAGQSRTATFATLTVGAVATVTFETTASCALADGALINNTAMITATEIDPDPANNSASSTTTAINPPPVITLNPFLSFWPPNHKYQTVTVAQMVQSVTDNCPISVDAVVIEKVTSDEPGNALGDGNTIDDIVIGANCRSVQLRAERAGPGDGRVYTITLRLRDSGGAVTRADFEVSVPHSQNGDPAVKGATAFTVTSNCP
jgi:uncharacterized repeat protein (TIGR01451 family)